MEDDPVVGSNSSIEVNKTTTDLDDLIKEMNEKCVITATKPFPDFIHATPESYQTDSPKLMATLDACPFPTYDRLMPFPFYAIGQKDTKLREILFNKSMGELASLILFSPIPIFLPPVAAMLTGKVPSNSLSNLKIQEKRYLDIFKTLYDAAPDKSDFLYSKEAEKLRFLDRELTMNIRNLSRNLEKLSIQSWDPVQSSVSIFVFYSKTMDIIRQRHGFVSESNVKEFERYSKIIADAEKELADRFSTIMDELVSNNPRAAAAIDHMKKHVFSLINEEKFSFDLDKKVNQVDIDLLTSTENPETVAGFRDIACHTILNFTLETLAAMEKWLLTVCGVDSKFHDSVSLLRQPSPPLHDVPESLLKEMKNQLLFIHNARKDTFASLWPVSATQPVLIFYAKHDPSHVRAYLVQIFKALALTRTRYLAIIDNSVRCKNATSKKVSPENWTPKNEPVMQFFPDPPSRRQPLSVFSFSCSHESIPSSSSN